MSQQVSYSDTVTIVPSGYDSSNSSYRSISSSYPISNGYDAPSSTSYAYITCNTGSQAVSYISYTFDVSEIPLNATITSVAASARARVSSTSYISTAVLQLYNDSTAMGSSTSARTTTATTYTLTPGTWTRAQLSNIQVRYTATRGTSNTTSSAYMYFYGAEITVAYSVDETKYEITINNSTSVTVAASESLVSSGDEVFISASSLDGITVTDNGTDVTNRFEVGGNGTITAYPGNDLDTGFSSSNASFYLSSSQTGTDYFEYALGHSAESPGSTGSNNTYVKDGSNNTATGWVIYSFDFSEIPVGATINSVTVRCYGAREDTTIDSTHMARIGLYSGNTLKGSEQDFTSTSNSIVTISSPGIWTRDELQDAKLRFTVAYYGGRIMGVTWIVSYTASGYLYTITNVAADHVIAVSSSGSGPVMYIKNGGSWVQALAVYKKVNGNWVLQSDLTNIFNSGVNYLKG